MKNLKSPTEDAPRLAISGGRPHRNTPMPARLAFGQDEELMLAKVIKYYRDRNLDPGYQDYFEEKYCDDFSRFIGGGYADAVATGTAALYVAIAALNLPKGSEILVSPITDPGTLSAVILNGHIPRLVDSKPGSYNIDSIQLEKRITPKTRAAIIVHSVGIPVEMEKIMEIATNKTIKVVEDCSQSHGATIRQRHVGTFGQVAAFSSMYKKAHITGSCGGIIFTSDLEFHRQGLAHADRGKPRWSPDFNDRNPSDYLFPALNLHSNELACGIGIASLKRLPETIRKRRNWVKKLSERINLETKTCSILEENPESSPFILPIKVETNLISGSVKDFAEAIKLEGIPLNSHYDYLVNDWTWIKSYLSDDFLTNNAKSSINNSFCLYLNEQYGDQEIDDVLGAIAKCEGALCF